jgi:hypothetical protein
MQLRRETGCASHIAIHSSEAAATRYVSGTFFKVPLPYRAPLCQRITLSQFETYLNAAETKKISVFEGTFLMWCQGNSVQASLI